jgi:lipopolysaccharide export LptBFGC system permease protein LptF
LNPLSEGFSLKELLLSAVFVIHAAAFAYLYFRRGRRGFHLLFVGGFLLLTVFYASSGSLSFAGAEPRPAYLSAFRWAGLFLCGLATPPFLIHWYRRRRGDPAPP